MVSEAAKHAVTYRKAGDINKPNAKEKQMDVSIEVVTRFERKARRNSCAISFRRTACWELVPYSVCGTEQLPLLVETYLTTGTMLLRDKLLEVIRF